MNLNKKSLQILVNKFLKEFAVSNPDVLSALQKDEELDKYVLDFIYRVLSIEKDLSPQVYHDLYTLVTYFNPSVKYKPLMLQYIHFCGLYNVIKNKIICTEFCSNCDDLLLKDLECLIKELEKELSFYLTC